MFPTATDHGYPLVRKRRVTALEGRDLGFGAPPKSIDSRLWRIRLRGFAGDESGTQAIEVLLIFVAVVVPCFAAALLLQQVFFEYLEVTTIFVTSPFF